MIKAFLYAVGAVAGFFESRSISRTLRDIDHIEKRQIEIHEAINTATNSNVPRAHIDALFRRLQHWEERGASFDERLQGLKRQATFRERDPILATPQRLRMAPTQLADSMRSPITLIGKTNGRETSEHKVTWLTMLASFLAIAAQTAGQLILGIDLGVDINLALATGFGSGAAYTVARMAVKMGISFAEGKVKTAAQSQATLPPAVDPPPSSAPEPTAKPTLFAGLESRPSPFEDTTPVY